METGSHKALRRPRVEVAKPTKRRSHRATAPQLLDRRVLDGRTNAAKIYDGQVTAIEHDLGGPDRLSSIEHNLVEAFVGSYVVMNNLNTRMLLGQQIDFSEHAQAVSAMVKVASRLGIKRIARDVTVPTLNQYLALRHDSTVGVEAAE
jgi:hypothetical protein